MLYSRIPIWLHWTSKGFKA